MKRNSFTTAYALTLAALFALGLLCSGCGTFDKLYNRQPVVTAPSQVAVPSVVTNYVTNLVVLAPVTNIVTGEIAPARTITNTVRELLTVTNIVELPAVTNYILTPRPEIQAATQLTGALPIPWAGTAALALGWLYSVYASVRNKKLSAALVQGIEAGREFLNETPEGAKLDDKFKSYLISHQETAGVLNAASKLVNQLTGNTK